MRIITGSARGATLETLDGEHTRPTAERVKEAIFSMIQFDIEGRSILDLFGGSGQLALEALSRGAAGALIADSDRDACAVIKRNAQKTKLFQKTRILCSDYKTVIRGLAGREKFDIIFLDPPYASDYVEDSLKRLIEADAIAEGAYIICEGERSVPFSCEGLNIIKHNKYGRVYITLLQKEI